MPRRCSGKSCRKVRIAPAQPAGSGLSMGRAVTIGSCSAYQRAMCGPWASSSPNKSRVGIVMDRRSVRREKGCAVASSPSCAAKKLGSSCLRRARRMLSRSSSIVTVSSRQASSPWILARSKNDRPRAPRTWREWRGRYRATAQAVPDAPRPREQLGARASVADFLSMVHED